MLNYEDHIAAFQSGDDDLLVDRLFADDLVHHELRAGLINHIRVGCAGAEGEPKRFNADGTPKATK